MWSCFSTRPFEQRQEIAVCLWADARGRFVGASWFMAGEVCIPVGCAVERCGELLAFARKPGANGSIPGRTVEPGSCGEWRVNPEPFQTGPVAPKILFLSVSSQLNVFGLTQRSRRTQRVHTGPRTFLSAATLETSRAQIDPDASDIRASLRTRMSAVRRVAALLRFAFRVRSFCFDKF